jgi:hypothetical protein
MVLRPKSGIVYLCKGQTLLLHSPTTDPAERPVSVLFLMPTVVCMGYLEVPEEAKPTKTALA